MRQSVARRAMRAILAASPIWDPASMKISPEGQVTALKAPWKTMRNEAPTRYVVGYVKDMLPHEATKLVQGR